MAEGARLLSEYPGKPGSRVQIPLSPPYFLHSKKYGEISPSAEGGEVDSLIYALSH